MTVEVRIATAADIPAIAALRWAEDGGDETGLDEFVRDFVEWVADHATHHCIAAFDGDRAVGMGWLAELPRVPGLHAFDRAGGDVQTVFLLPDYRGRGVGTELMRQMTSLASELALGRVTVHASTRAIPLYNRAGFTPSPKQLVREPTVDE